MRLRAAPRRQSLSLRGLGTKRSAGTHVDGQQVQGGGARVRRDAEAHDVLRLQVPRRGADLVDRDATHSTLLARPSVRVARVPRRQH